MEKVLRESDDGILVYIAPTKALVTQIAAEVYARFSKSLHGGTPEPIFVLHLLMIDISLQQAAGRYILVTIVYTIHRNVKFW